ncbi:MAG: PQQ-binding-like beta-propeller repeat protein, partial [Acidobacteriaceae bacterium]|nr:PQQ-binding-like beta-propeller repeat protein [Acidobacteriaceae bacterium]
METKLAVRIRTATAATALSLYAAAAVAQTNWATFGFDPQRTGYNPQETVLSPQTVPSLELKWFFSLGSEGVTAQPVEARGIVFTMTDAGTVYAFDEKSGQAIWSKQLGVTQTDCGAGTDLPNGIIGNVATPTVDQSNFGLLIVSGDGLLHAFDGAVGSEWPGYPIQIMDPYNRGRTFVYGAPLYDWTHSTLNIATASGCDQPPYRGQIVQVLHTGKSRPIILKRWFTDGAQGPDGGGIWGPGGLSADAGFGAFYTATGNALTTPESYGYADKIVRFDYRLNVQASNGPNISDGDLDFGSTPVLYEPPGCPAQLAALNKNGQLFVYNRNAIGGGPIQVLQIASTSSGEESRFIGAVAYDPVFNHI